MFSRSLASIERRVTAAIVRLGSDSPQFCKLCSNAQQQFFHEYLQNTENAENAEVDSDAAILNSVRTLIRTTF